MAAQVVHFHSLLTIPQVAQLAIVQVDGTTQVAPEGTQSPTQAVQAVPAQVVHNVEQGLSAPQEFPDKTFGEVHYIHVNCLFMSSLHK